MTKSKSLVDGIGSIKKTTKYYDDWSNKYDYTLNKWKYTVPKKSINLLKKKLKYHPKKILDLACGTGLFGEELIKIYKKSQIYGSDISYKSLMIAKKKKIYQNLVKLNYEKKKKYRIKFQLVSMIGAMTYCKNFDKLFENINFYLLKKGHFVFSHRTDLWKKQKFYRVLENLKNDFKINYISRPCNYLPLNQDFKNKIKIRLVLLQKY
tara:strand:+ start:41 stop:664 length:624 start_codon:yes stop_codon:yes gene_type:complete